MKKNVVVVFGVVLTLFSACKEVDTKLYPLNEDGFAHKTAIQDEFQRPDEGWHYAYVDTTSFELMVKYDADAVEINEVETYLTKHNWLKIIVADTMALDSMVTDSLVDNVIIEGGVEKEAVTAPSVKKQHQEKNPTAHDSIHHAESDSTTGW